MKKVSPSNSNEIESGHPPYARRGLLLTRTAWSHACPSSQEMAACDAGAISSGVTGAELMQRAGQAMFHAFESHARRRGLHGAWAILCGPGNNGGDGFVIARMCAEHGIPVRVIMSKLDGLSVEATHMLEQLRKVELELFSFAVSPFTAIIDERSAVEILSQSAVVLDALLGTGQMSAPRGAIAEVLRLLELARRRPRVPQLLGAVDIPTGVNASTGEVFDSHFCADVTVTVEAPKRGMLQYPGRGMCGEIEAVSVGIDCTGMSEYSLVDEDSCARITQRRPDAHKGSFAPVLVVGGSAPMPGAPVLSAHAALRAGAGLVRLARPVACARAGAELSWPEVMPIPVKGVAQLVSADFSALKPYLQPGSVLVIGPGLGRNEKTAALVSKLVKCAAKTEMAVVVDADAITMLCSTKRQRYEHCVFTPHPGEMSRVLGVSSAEVQHDRFMAIQKAQQRFGGVWVLKGVGSLIKSEQAGAVCLAGTPWMATAGSGDVLAGVVAAMLAQGLPLYEAASTAVLVHGMAGERCMSLANGPIIASDLIGQLPALIAEFVA
ncbi:MAG: NAD(P)H-hydrate dehydratase [Oligoflexia bacterium]|nr:NAD(P)H-hydrate dehydratase [Oligoflexia bacterium]